MSNWYVIYMHTVVIALLITSAYSVHLLIQLNKKPKTKTKNYGTQKDKKTKHLLHEPRWSQNVIPGINDNQKPSE